MTRRWVAQRGRQGRRRIRKLVVTNVQDAASKFSWLLIPLSVPFLWLLFPFSRRYRLYDHTVFVTYSLSFMMMLVIAGGCWSAVGWSGLPASCSSCRRSTCIGSSRGLPARPVRRAVADVALVTIFAFMAAACSPGMVARRDVRRSSAGQGNFTARIRIIASVMSILARSAGGIATSRVMNSSLPRLCLPSGGQ